MPSPRTGQVALSGSAQQLGPTASGVAFIIKAPLSNANPAYIGPSTVSPTTGYQLDPGDELTYERISQAGVPTYEMSVADFWAVGTAPDKVVWLVSP